MANGNNKIDGMNVVEVTFIERNEIGLHESGFAWDDVSPRDSQMEVHLIGAYESTSVDVDLNADMSLSEIKEMVEDELLNLSDLLISWGCTQKIVVDLGCTTFTMELNN